MAPYAKFVIPFAFAAAGLLVWLIQPNWFGLATFVGLFVVGSILGTIVFKRFATPAQIRADLEARKFND